MQMKVACRDGKNGKRGGRARQHEKSGTLIRIEELGQALHWLDDSKIGRRCQTVYMSDATLFPEMDQPPAIAVPRGPFAAVAIERALDRVLDYSVPPALISSLRVGQRVRVPLGRKNRPTHGYVVGLADTTTLTRVKPT